MPLPRWRQLLAMQPSALVPRHHLEHYLDSCWVFLWSGYAEAITSQVIVMDFCPSHSKGEHRVGVPQGVPARLLGVAGLLLGGIGALWMPVGDMRAAEEVELEFRGGVLSVLGSTSQAAQACPRSESFTLNEVREGNALALRLRRLPLEHHTPPTTMRVDFEILSGSTADTADLGVRHSLKNVAVRFPETGGGFNSWRCLYLDIKKDLKLEGEEVLKLRLMPKAGSYRVRGAGTHSIKIKEHGAAIRLRYKDIGELGATAAERSFNLRLEAGAPNPVNGSGNSCSFTVDRSFNRTIPITWRVFDGKRSDLGKADLADFQLPATVRFRNGVAEVQAQATMDSDGVAEDFAIERNRFNTPYTSVLCEDASANVPAGVWGPSGVILPATAPPEETTEEPQPPEDVTAPAAVKNLQARPANGAVRLLWDDPDDPSIQGYKYRQRRAHNGRNWGPWQKISGSDAQTTSHLVSGLNNGVKYLFKVRALNAAGAGRPSATKGATPLDVLTLSVADGRIREGDGGTQHMEFVVRLDGEPISDVKLRVSAAAVAGNTATATEGTGQDFIPFSKTIVFAAYSRAHWRDDRNNDLEQTVRVEVIGDQQDEDDETFQLLLDNLVSSDARVVLHGGGEKLRVTGVISDDDASPVLTPMEDITAQVGQALSILAAATDADGDPISYTWSTDGQTPDLPEGTALNQAQLSFTPNAPGVYNMRVTATDAHGNAASEDVTITVAAPPALPAAPTGLSAQPGHAQVILTWDNPNDASITGYELQQKVKGEAWGAWTPISHNGEQTLSHTVTGLNNGTTYSYKIRAVNEAGTGAASQEVVTATTGPLTLSVANAQVTEGNKGQTDMVFTLTLSDSPTADVKLQATALAGPGSTATASEGNSQDFIPLNKTIKFDANAQGDGLKKTVHVKVLGDYIKELDETFLLRLDNLETEDQRVAFASGGEKMHAIGTITDDDLSGVSEHCEGKRIHNGGRSSIYKNLHHEKRIGFDYFVDSVRERAMAWWDSNSVRIITNQPASRDITFKITFADGSADYGGFVGVGGSAAANGADYDGTPQTVTLPAGQTVISVPIPIVDDDLVEEEETLTVCLEPTEPLPDGYHLVYPSITLFIDDDDGFGSGPHSMDVLVSDATVREGPDAQLTFKVNLRGRPRGWVDLKYATRDITAAAGADYIATSGTLRFNPGETEKIINVPVLDDAHDEGSETMELFISEASGSYPRKWVTPIRTVFIERYSYSREAGRYVLTDSFRGGSGVGTIVNTDPIPAAWLSRFGRTVADQVLDAIAGRVAADRTPGLTGSLAGQPLSNETLGLGNNSVTDTAQADTTLSLADGDSLTSYQSMTAQDLLLGSAFTLTRATGVEGKGGTLAFWGAAAHSAFDGKEDSLSLDGQVTTGLLGIDYARSRWLLGLGISHSAGKGNYSDSTTASGLKGKIETSLTAALPYGAWQVSDRVKLWGAVGYGMGQMRLEPDGIKEIKADINWSMAAVGARAALLDPDGEGLSLDLISDALWSRITSEKTTNLASTESDVTRLRLGLEGSWQISLDNGGEVLPKLSLGARYDGGDAETGLGVELGGGMVWSAPQRGITLDLGGRTLLLHAAEGLKDWGVSASLIFDPNPETERGLSVSLGQEWGGQATDGLDALFAANPLEQRSGVEGISHWSLEAAYGFPVFAGHFTGSPYVGLGIGSGLRDYSIGWRLSPETTAQQDISLDLKATRSEDDGARPEHRLGFELQRAW